MLFFKCVEAQPDARLQIGRFFSPERGKSRLGGGIETTLPVLPIRVR
jgi:hypothetical protein